jgi:hypothetical protein
MITGVELSSQWPIARGGFADIYMGQYLRKDVAVKCLAILHNGHEPGDVHRVSRMTYAYSMATSSLLSLRRLESVGLLQGGLGMAAIEAPQHH